MTRDIHVKYTPLLGDGIGVTADNMWTLCQIQRLEVRAKHNDVELVCRPGDKMSAILQQWEAATERR